MAGHDQASLVIFSKYEVKGGSKLLGTTTTPSQSIQTTNSKESKAFLV